MPLQIFDISAIQGTESGWGNYAILVIHAQYFIRWVWINNAPQPWAGWDPMSICKRS